MATNEFEELVQGTIRRSGPIGAAPFVQQVTQQPVAEQHLTQLQGSQQHVSQQPIWQQQAVPVAQPAQEMGRAALEIEQLRRATTLHSEATRQNSEVVSRSSTTSKEENGSLGGTVLKTVGMLTGVGPLVAGLLSIFSSRKEEEHLPLQTFSRPSSIAVDAGLTTGGSFTEIQYTQSGLARPVSSQQSASNQRQAAGKEAASVQINVQAMDSRSFLDHSDDIARAVKDAILHSHSLNDVVSEL